LGGVDFAGANEIVDDRALSNRANDNCVGSNETSIEGYSGFVCDSEFSQPPRAAFDLLVEWVGRGAKQQTQIC